MKIELPTKLSEEVELVARAVGITADEFVVNAVDLVLDQRAELPEVEPKIQDVLVRDQAAAKRFRGRSTT